MTIPNLGRETQIHENVQGRRSIFGTQNPIKRQDSTIHSKSLSKSQLLFSWSPSNDHQIYLTPETRIERPYGKVDKIDDSPRRPGVAAEDGEDEKPGEE